MPMPIELSQGTLTPAEYKVFKSDSTPTPTPM